MWPNGMRERGEEREAERGEKSEEKGAKGKMLYKCHNGTPVLCLISNN